MPGDASLGLLIGAVLALAIGLFATIVGLDRDRAFYPAVMIVIALYYALFAVMGGSRQALLLELLFIVAFVGAAVVGFKHSLYLAWLLLRSKVPATAARP